MVTKRQGERVKKARKTGSSPARQGKCSVCGEPIRLTARSSATPKHRACRAGADRPAAATDRAAYLRGVLEGIQRSIDKAPPEKRAPLYGQLLACEARIAALPSADGSQSQGKAGDPVDEIAARRAARGGAVARLGHAAERPR
ncbi:MULTISPECIES: hypothetical protein [unclassified Isoptericola]|uniref:hypothetical protein n=1 Tax=unclassified Isoptericola TaxID=2623355 RepID=UPI00365B5152